MSKVKNDKEWMQGFICAVGTFANFEGGTNTHIEEALQTVGIRSVADLRKNNADEFDIKALKPAIKSMQATAKYKRCLKLMKKKELK